MGAEPSIMPRTSLQARPHRWRRSYTLICTSTDYDAWRVGHAPVTVEEVVKTLHTNAGNARAVAAGLLQDVHDVVAEGKVLDEIKGCMRFACVTRSDVSGQGRYHITSPQTNPLRRDLMTLSMAVTVAGAVADAAHRSSRRLRRRSCRSSFLTLLRQVQN
jgi:hypothetical protein